MGKNYNYNKTKTEELNNEVQEVVDELLGVNAEESSEESVTEKLTDNTSSIGVVCNCEMLNVREEPSKESKSLCIIKAGDEVEINGEDPDFYNVITESGVKGYCMKQFISLKN